MVIWTAHDLFLGFWSRQNESQVLTWTGGNPPVPTRFCRLAASPLARCRSIALTRASISFFGRCFAMPTPPLVGTVYTKTLISGESVFGEQVNQSIEIVEFKKEFRKMNWERLRLPK